MKSLATIMYQLQTALKMKGFIVAINTTQFYSDQQDRFVKVYHVKHKREEIVSTASQIVVVRCLKQMLDCIRNLEATRVDRAEWEAAVMKDIRNNKYLNPINLNQ